MRRYIHRRRRLRTALICAVLCVSVFGVLTLFEFRVRPIITEVAVSRAKNTAVRVISDVVNDTMSKISVNYTDLVQFQKNGSEIITAVTANIVEINKLKSTLTSKIEEKISDIDSMTARIPLGNLLGQSALTGLGPKIKIKMIPVGYAVVNIQNEFTEAGINQTKHKIFLKAGCTISVLLPISSCSAFVETEIPIAETIIVGAVPDTYTHVTGQEDPNDSVLNMLP